MAGTPTDALLEGGRLRVRLCAAAADQPILTAFAVKGDEERLLEAGMDGYASKPVDFGRLAEEIRKACGKMPRDSSGAG